MPPRLTIWGCRGSIPVGGPGTARHGGATACVVLEDGDRRLILDAGSGLRQFGLSLAESARTGHHDILLSHAHWDHVLGLPFFAPLYDAEATVTVLGPDQPASTLDQVVRGLLAPAVWPLVPAARLQVRAVTAGAVEGTAFQVRAHRVAHAGVTLGYRIDTETGPSVSYITDNELGRMHSGERAELVHFVAGSDVLIHDAAWPDALLPERAGWGHSSVGEAIALGMDAGCRTVVLFHHDPDADDATLERNLAAQPLPGDGVPAVLLARDGMTLEL